MIELRKISITDSDMVRECIELDVAPEQRAFVAHNAKSLGEAYACNKRGYGCATPCAIYADGTMVGFIMYEFVKEEDHGDTYSGDAYYLWRFMIDQKHQGKGYGKQALAQAIDEVKKMPNGKAEYFYTGYEPENTDAKKLYESLGFVETGQVVDDEIVARLKL